MQKLFSVILFLFFSISQFRLFFSLDTVVCVYCIFRFRHFFFAANMYRYVVLRMRGYERHRNVSVVQIVSAASVAKLQWRMHYYDVFVIVIRKCSKHHRNYRSQWSVKCQFYNSMQNYKSNDNGQTNDSNDIFQSNRFMHEFETKNTRWNIKIWILSFAL